MDMTREKANFYAFTQTLGQNMRQISPVNTQFTHVLPFIKEFLNKCCYDYELWPELHQSGDVHFHGILDIKDKIKYYKTLKKHTERIGNVLLKNIDDMAKWKEYCGKDIKDMEKLFKIKLPIRKTVEIKRIQTIEEYYHKPKTVSLEKELKKAEPGRPFMSERTTRLQRVYGEKTWEWPSDSPEQLRIETLERTNKRLKEEIAEHNSHNSECEGCSD